MFKTLINKVAGLRTFIFITKKFKGSGFPVKFAKFLTKPILKNICERLLPYLHVILFTMHEKDAANDACVISLEYICWVFLRQSTTYDFHKKVLS